MPDTLSAAAHVAIAPDGSRSWEVPDGWQQGRGAWGGLVVAALVGAVEAAEPARPVRSVSAHLPAPVTAGTHPVSVSCLRAGSSMSTWEATVGEPVLARATVVTGTARADAGALRGTARMPELPAWPGVPVVPVGPPLGPVFAPRVEFRLVTGMPLAGGQPTCSGYVRMAQPEPWTAASLLGLVDAWWPASYPALDRPRPMATVSFEAQLLADPASVPAEPLGFSSELLAAHEGFTTERRSLWAADGRLVVENLQSIVVIA